jgi:CDP-paratose 2-epimerase
MNILITGGCGFVGANLCISLSKYNYKIVSIDNLSKKGSRYNLKLISEFKVKNLKIDIKDYKKIDNLPKFDFIIHCCAEPAVEISKNQIDKVVNTNLIGTINILKKVKKDKSKIIFISSSRVYPIDKINDVIKKKDLKKRIKINKTFNENFSLLGPKTIYGVTKLASEMFIQEFSYAFNIKFIINRCAVISGPLQFGKQDQGFVSLWIWRHLIKNKLSYIGYGGHGNQIRDVLHIYDLCDLINLQIKKFNIINNELFTIGGSKKNSVSLKQLSEICQKISGEKIIISKIIKTSNYDIPYFVTNNSKVMKKYNWKPKRNVYKIVLDTYNWIKLNKSKIKKFF